MAKNYCREFARQTRLLLKKNFTLLLRSKSATIIQLLVPFIFVFVLWALQFAIDENTKLNPSIANSYSARQLSVSNVNRCIPQPDPKGDGVIPCITLGYLPNNDPIVRELVEAIQEEHGIPEDEVMGFRSEVEANQYLFANPNTTQAVVHFKIDYGCDLSANPFISVPEYMADECYTQNHTINDVVGVAYVIQYNSTVTTSLGRALNPYYQVALPLQLAVESALFKVLGSGNVQLNISVASFPHPTLQSASVVTQVGTVFFFGALMFNFVIQIGQIVTEKEFKLRESMRVMGLLDSAYWLSWGIVNGVMNIISGLLLIASAAIFQFPLILKNDFPTYFILILLFSICMVPTAMFVSTLLSRSSTATTLGFAVFLVGSMIQAAASIVYDEDTSMAVQVIFSLFPPTPFAKGLSDLSAMTDAEGETGLRWADIDSYGYFPLTTCYVWLVGDFCIFLVLAIFFDNVIYMHRPPWFFLMPSYWTGSSKTRKNVNLEKDIDEDAVDSDVLAEEERVISGKASNDAVVIDNLNKTFYKKHFGCITNKKATFRAVKNVYFTIENGTLFCLLGHNGAGKTTTIRMLTGLYDPTHGDARIFGHSIIDGMAEIRQIMGVCPQHDILWPQLTAREHLELFAGLKDLPPEKIEAEVNERLNDVALTAAADLVAASYSGGMRRRLSVAIALIGDPKIVFLDEPTTGMDTVSRRQVWDLIERVKRGRVTLLTTHSMEEADILGDKIAIMKAGRIAAIGTSLRLKNKFGSGYTVSVVVNEESKLPAVEKFVFSTFEEITESTPSSAVNGLKEKPEEEKTKEKSKSEKKKDEGSTASPSDKVELKSSAHNVATFKVPVTLGDYLPSFFEKLEEKRKKLGVQDFQLSMTTLEEVFIKVAEEESPPEKARKKKKMSNKRKILIGAAIALLIVAIIVAIATGVSIRKARENTPQRVAPIRSAEPNAFTFSSGRFDENIFPTPVLVGDVTPYRAQISLHTYAPSVDIHVLKQRGSQGWEQIAVISNQTPLPGTNIVQYEFVSLEPDTAYTVYSVAGNDSTVHSKATRFRSAPLPSSEPRVVTFGATSSFGRTNAPWESLKVAASENLDFFMLLGDTAYVGDNLANVNEKWLQALSTEGFAALASSTSLFATWNDQEITENWFLAFNSSNPVFRNNIYAIARQAFEQALPIRHGTDDTLYRSYSFGAVDIFILDLQSEREGNQIMSPTQLNWLKNSLSASTAKFKFVMSSVPISDMRSLSILHTGSWAFSYSGQRQELLDYITSNEIKGVVFVSGDLQFGVVGPVEPVPQRNDSDSPVPFGAYNVTEVAVGPVGMRIRPEISLNARIALGGSRFSKIIESWSWTRFTVEPVLGTVKVEFVNDAGIVIADHTIELFEE